MSTVMRTTWIAALLLIPVSAFAQSEDEMRAKELIAKIQKEMSEIDKLLLEADSAGAAGESAEKLEEVAKSIEELLRSVQDNQASVVRDIEELVKLTKYQQSQGWRRRLAQGPEEPAAAAAQPGAPEGRRPGPA